jgi:phosphoesterase RecJ-like protein
MDSIISQTAPQILEAIKKAKNILLHLHPRPDGDSVGSSLAMKGALEGMRKSVTLIKGDSILPAYLSHLPGFNTIVEKNIFEIDLSQFDLFIIQDSAALEKVTGLGEIVFPSTLKTVVIDHHASNQSFGEINLIDPSYPAVCQMLVDLFNEWKIAISHDMAICLFAGMYTDTGGFKYSGVSSKTFSAAAQLVAIAPDCNKAISLMENQNTKEKIAYEALALSSISTHLNDTLAISAVSFEQLKEKGIPREEAKGEIANILKSVVGWEIGASLVEEAPNEVKLSMRAKIGSEYDLSKVALALGGGGHKAAAGVSLKMSLNEALEKVVGTIKSLYGDELK